jgi:2-polyprenyl-3-methyl-5-hydroxy-6-metoxy-1,4-benzoquinol methylase
MVEEHPKSNYDTWHRHHSSDDDITASWHMFIKKNLRQEDVDGKKILEIGCGRGGFSNYLANVEKAPDQVFACDYSHSALEIAQHKYAHSGITWKQQDIMAMNFPSESFDTAISCETIEHVPDPAKAISELYRVLKPGGRLLLTCPNYFNLFGIWCIYRWAIGKPYTEGGQPYVNYILMPKLYFWIRKSGFKMAKFTSAEIIIPARIPRHFYHYGTPLLLRIFGHRTFYVLIK